ncbi:MAG: hypothetical protein EHM36_14395 [Deltaproteobacteria bacterium]|nr:MAG: hypothetical protein EHM36_14395 [Deltaproteobacteria bacterium]
MTDKIISCPVCGKRVSAVVSDGTVVMFGLDDNHHSCATAFTAKCCLCRGHKGQHFDFSELFWICDQHPPLRPGWYKRSEEGKVFQEIADR